MTFHCYAPIPSYITINSGRRLKCSLVVMPLFMSGKPINSLQNTTINIGVSTRNSHMYQQIQWHEAPKSLTIWLYYGELQSGTGKQTSYSFVMFRQKH